MHIPYLPILYQSFWRDEAFSALVAVHQPLTIIQLMMKDQSPPLYFLVLHFWMQWFGEGEVPIRLLSYVFFIGLIISAYVLSTKILHTFLSRILFLSTLFFNPFLLQYAFEARPYSLFAFCIVSACAALVYDRFFLASIFLSLAVFSHNFALFSLVSVAIWFLYIHRNNFLKSIPDLFFLFALPSVSFLAWSGAIFQQVSRVSAQFWITEKTSAMYYYAYTSFTTGSLWVNTHDILLFFSFTLTLIGVSPLIMRSVKNTHITSYDVLTLLLALVPLICTYVISHVKTPIYYDRYLIACLPFIFILIAQGLEYIYIQCHMLWKIGLGLLLYGYMLTLFSTYQVILRTSTKPAINWAVSQSLQKAHPEDIMVSETDLNFLETKWYARKNAKNIRVHIVSPHGSLPYYIGTAVVDPGDVIRTLPVKTTVWVIQQNGGYHKEITR